MSGYIPHDDDVEMAYIHGASLDYPVAGRADALRAEFDRWLAQVKAEVWDEGATYVAKQESMLIEPDENPYREEKK